MDIDKLIGDAIGEMKGVIGEAWPKAEKYVTRIMEKNKNAIQEITEFYLNGELTEDEFKEELLDNMKTLESELLVLNILKKKTVEDAINAGFESCLQTVTIVMGII